jgi:hypothetical protein
MASLNPDGSSEVEQAAKIKLMTIQLRLDAARAAINRSRFAFLASTIASLAILIPAWNAYASWYRGFAMRPAPYNTTAVVDEAQKQVVSEWVKNLTITTGFLGIRVGISDAAVVGAVGLWVIVIWLYFSMRGANRTIGFLLQDTQNEKLEIRDMIFHGVAAHLVFSDVESGDIPIENLKEIPSKDSNPTARWVVEFLLYLPAITIFTIVALDIASIVVLNSAFRPHHEPLWYELKDASWITWVQVICWEGLAIILGVATARLCKKIVRFEKTTGDVIREYNPNPKGGDSSAGHP